MLTHKKYSRIGILFLVMCLAIVNPSFGQDTLNRTDANGKKFGLWRIYGNNKTYVGKGYIDNAIVDEGRFVDGKKVGIWKQFYPSQKIKSEIEYKNGRPNGKFCTYYENGCPEEKGTWRANMYVDSFYRYREDTCGKILQKKYFNAAGKDLNQQKTIHGGCFGSENDLVYDSKPSQDTLKKSGGGCMGGGSGPERLYDSQKRVVQEGEFKNGRLWSGRWYRYNTDGLLTKIEVYKNGKYMGDEVIKDCWTSTPKGKQLTEDGEYKNGKLWNGKKYVYDKNGLILKIEIWKNGKYFADGQIE